MNEIPDLQDVFPIQDGRSRLEVEPLGIIDGQLRAEATLLHTDDDGNIVDVKSQEVRIPRERRALWAAAEEARQRLGEPDFQPEGCGFPAELFATRHAYCRVPAPPPGADWTQAVAMALHAQAEANGFDARYARIRHWPKAARIVFFLWEAELQLGGNGIEAYLLRSHSDPASAVLDMLAAFDEAGCTRLAQRYRQGLGLALAQGAGDLRAYIREDILADASLSPPPPPPGETDPWRAIDSWDEDGTYALLERELRSALERYARAHAGELLG